MSQKVCIVKKNKSKTTFGSLSLKEFFVFGERLYMKTPLQKNGKNCLCFSTNEFCEMMDEVIIDYKPESVEITISTR